MSSIAVTCPSQDSFLRMFLRALLTPKRGKVRPGNFPHFITERQGIRVRPEQLAAYREVCGYPQDAFLPILFPYIQTVGLQMNILTHHDFPLRAFGLVHARNQITQHRPLGIAETFDATCQVRHSRIIKSGLEFDMEVSVYADGALVWENISTYLCRGHFGDADHNAPKPALSEIPPNAETIEWTVPKDMGRRYARITGDYNPIHVSSLAAKLFGFPRAIIHGLWSAGVCAARLPGASLTYPAKYDVLFKGPVFLGSTVKTLVEDSEHECRFDLYCGNNPRPCLCGLITTSGK